MLNIKDIFNIKVNQRVICLFNHWFYRVSYKFLHEILPFFWRTITNIYLWAKQKRFFIIQCYDKHFLPSLTVVLIFHVWNFRIVLIFHNSNISWNTGGPPCHQDFFTFQAILREKLQFSSNFVLIPCGQNSVGPPCPKSWIRAWSRYNRFSVWGRPTITTHRTIQLTKGRNMYVRTEDCDERFSFVCWRKSCQILAMACVLIWAIKLKENAGPVADAGVSSGRPP